MLDTGGAQWAAQRNLGGDLRGGQDNLDKGLHPLGDRSRDIGVSQAEVWKCGDGDGWRPDGQRALCGGGGKRDMLGLGGGGRILGEGDAREEGKVEVEEI